MDLLEHQGRELLDEAKIPIPKGFVFDDPEEVAALLEKLDGQAILKVQVPIGKRGKHGGIKKISSPAEAKAEAKHMLETEIRGFKPESLLIVEPISVENEFYLSLTLDRAQKDFVIIFSDKGGMDVEEAAQKFPNRVRSLPISKLKTGKDTLNFLSAFNLSQKIAAQIADIILKTIKLAQSKDASLVEINPLAETTDHKIIALDAKIKIDNNALFRQKQFQKQIDPGKTALERQSEKEGFTFVELDGKIAVLGNGAGLVMASLDILEHYGGKPASFLDVGGGATAERITKALEISLQRKIVKGLFINVFGGITKADEIAKALVDYKDKLPADFPISVRLTGTNEEEARSILDVAQIKWHDSMEDAAKNIVENVYFN